MMRWVIAAAFLLPVPGRAMDFSLIEAKDGQFIRAAGDIVDKDDEKLHQFVAALPPETKLLAFIMTSPGGNLREGVRLAETIRASELETGVVDQCASACFLMFAAGRSKFVIDDAEVGVHSASATGGRETTESQAVTTLMARAASDYGVPASIIGKMVTTPPEKMTWLTPEDLKAMGAQSIYTQSAAYRPGSRLRPGSGPAPKPPAPAPAPAAATTNDSPAPQPPTAQPPARSGRMVGRIRPSD